MLQPIHLWLQIELLCFIFLHHFKKSSSISGLEVQTDYEKNNNQLFIDEISTSAETLRGSNFRIYATNYPPIMSSVKDVETGLVTYKGLAVELYDYLAERYNLTVVYVPENTLEVAKYGQIQALINAVVNKSFDLSSTGFTPSPERVRMFDMTSPSISESFQLMVKWPEEVEKHWTVLAIPFDGITWLLVAISFLAVIGMFSALALLVQCKRGNWPLFKTILETVNTKGMYIIGITTNHGQSIPYNSRLPLRIVLSLWLLMMIVLINSYTGVLTSLLTVSKLKPIPQSLEELASMKDYRVTVSKTHFLATAFLNSTVGHYKVLGDALRENPELLYSEYSQATENVLKKHAANVESSMAISFRIAADFKANGNCRFTASNLLTHTQSYSSVLPKDSPYTKLVDKETWRLLETGLIDHWRKKHIPRMDRCKLNGKKSSDDGKPKSIKLIQLTCAFFVLAVGIGLALLAFLLENIVSFGKNMRGK